MKAKTEEEGGEGGGRIQIPVLNPTAVKSFLHQLNSDVINEDANKQEKSVKKNALSRLIELPLDKKDPPSIAAKPSSTLKSGIKPSVTPAPKPQPKPVIKPATKPPAQAILSRTKDKPIATPKEKAAAVITARLDAKKAEHGNRCSPSEGIQNKTQTNGKQPLRRTDDWWRDRQTKMDTQKNRVNTPIQRRSSQSDDGVLETRVRAKSDSSSVKSGKRGGSPARKPSFKVAAHRTNSNGPKTRHTVKVTIPSSRVALLATKFNSLEEGASIPPNTPPIPTPSSPVKEVVKRQPSDIKIVVGNRARVIKREAVPPSLIDGVVALGSKIQSGPKAEEKTKVMLRKRPSFLTSKGGKVKAAVKIFEQESPKNSTLGGSVTSARSRVNSVPSRSSRTSTRPPSPLKEPTAMKLDGAAKKEETISLESSKKATQTKRFAGMFPRYVPNVPIPSTTMDDLPSSKELLEDEPNAQVSTLTSAPENLVNTTELVNEESEAELPRSVPESTTERATNPSLDPAPETAISDVPKTGYLTEDHPLFEDLYQWVGPPRSKESPDAKTKRAQQKNLLKTTKPIKTEEKRLVVVDFDDIDAIPDVPSKRDSVPSVQTEDDRGAKNSSSLPPVPSTPSLSKDMPPELPARNSIVLPQDAPPKWDAKEMDAKSGLLANSSFLWRATPLSRADSRSATQISENLSEPAPHPASEEKDLPHQAVPAIVNDDLPEPEATAGTEIDPELYDDIVPAVSGDALDMDLENIYDDIGVDVKKPPKKDKDVDGEMYETCGNYDDCEGEGYQFVDSKKVESPMLPEMTAEEEAEADDNLYDDVSSDRKPPTVPDDSMSLSSCYEAVYLARHGGLKTRLPVGLPGTGPRFGGINRVGVGRHGSSCSSTASSSHSSSGGNTSSYCGKMNSIYGEPLTDEQASAVAAVLGLPMPDHGYQPGPGRVPLSETSDEWVDLEYAPTDLEDQEEEETILVFSGQPRKRRGPGWSTKYRNRQRARSPRRRGDLSSDSDNENLYETLYEVVKTGNHPDIIPFDDFDSFDSDSDEDDTFSKVRHPSDMPGLGDVHNGKLPELPARENIYGVHVMRIKEAAGKKMQMLRKNWSLRKNDISNKLSRMRRKSNIDPSGAVPPSPPRTPPMEKCQSAGQLTVNKYWSFKSKFRRSISTSTPLGSTFYLTDELDINKEISSRLSQVDTSTESVSPVSQHSGPSMGAPNGPLPPRPPSVASQQNSNGERRSSGPIRPLSPPPPPPPPVPKRNGARKDKEKNKNLSSSWYAECGLFDSSTAQNSADVTPKRPTKEDPLNTSLYAEAGLWDSVATGSSPYDSSQSEHGSDSVHPLFSDEPLYQFYNASVFELARRQEVGEGDSDGYEEIVDGAVKTTRPSAMELIRPREGKHRTLWCEIPEVRESGVLDSLTTHQKKLQEAKFELITSEASYIKSLNVLEKHFMNSAEFRDETILSKSDRRILFSNVNPVRTRSEKFLADVERCWQESIMLLGICDIVYRHATEHFSVYTKYCTNQIYLDRTLKKLRDTESRFSEALAHLESSPECQSLSLHSFLMLPMQRITRLPLLMDAVLNRLGQDHDEYAMCKLALAALNKVVAECNEGARQMERYQEMMLLSHQIEFPRDVKPTPIISSRRWLVRSGALTQLIWRGDDAKLTFGRKVTKVSVHLFLFNDILVVTKQKGDENFCVLDYCARNLVQMMPMEGLPPPQQQLQPSLKSGENGRHLLLLTMLQNHDNKTGEMVLSCSESDRERWLAAVSPPQSDNPDERLYEVWDCPQVRAVHTYSAQQPDELSLDVGDVVNVLRKIKDGWWEGERIRDRERGWFPANHTMEIASAHIRSKNLKQRYRLLALSGSYLQESRSKSK